jgi:hypothetical protein
MPIKKYMAGAAFDPETIKVMIVAFNGVQVILNLANPDDRVVEIVAKKIISLSSLGCLDPAEIARRVIAPNGLLQMWPVSRRVNSSRAPGDDPTLIDRVAA